MRATLEKQTETTQSTVNSEAVSVSGASVKQEKNVMVNNVHAREKNAESKVGVILFVKPSKKVLVDCALYFTINTIMMYALLFVVRDVSIAMVSVVWVAIIAIRGGFSAGMLGFIAINASVSIAMHLPPHNTIPMPYYFNGRIPGFLIGFFQTFLCASIVGYISSLVHELKGEIKLRKKIQADLEQKVAELNAFGHTVAHDLKNPLMVINVSIGALVKEFGKSENPKVQKNMSFIQSGTIHMRNIIEALLLFAGLRKIDADQFETFSVLHCVDDALKRMEYFIEKSQARISKPGEWPSVFGYAPWITEVWVNYISNAIKYGGNQVKNIAPVIELGYDLPGSFPGEHPDHLRFWVKDNGDGVREEQAATLFKEFSRLHTSGNEGHGIGLSIVKSVIDKLKGTVGVESKEGAGSMFYFTLPVPHVSALSNNRG